MTEKISKLALSVSAILLVSCGRGGAISASPTSEGLATAATVTASVQADNTVWARETGPTSTATSKPTTSQAIPTGTSAPKRATTRPTGLSADPTVTYPDGCDRMGVQRIMASFLDGFNRGDRARMSRPLDLAALQWYVVNSHKRGQRITEIDTLKGEFVTATTGLDDADKRELWAYFHRRHQQGEILSLLRFDLVPDASDPDSMGVAYDLSRRADDLQGSLPTGGKAIIDCRTGKIIRWVMDSDR